MELRERKTSSGEIFAYAFDDGVKNAHFSPSLIVGSIPRSSEFQSEISRTFLSFRSYFGDSRIRLLIEIATMATKIREILSFHIFSHASHSLC